MPAVQSRLDSHHRNVIKVTEILQNARAEAAKSRKYESAPAHLCARCGRGSLKSSKTGHLFAGLAVSARKTPNTVPQSKLPPWSTETTPFEFVGTADDIVETELVAPESLYIVGLVRNPQERDIRL
ncbi:hypothetical protein B0H14DRAFT_2582898 [Mycena olivaceomarginata]|nr:hypothetical protein B0H14DRAFT_2582898 [Mycena olivaceomarginata]